MNYKGGRVPGSVPLRWRATVTTHQGLIDRPWKERGHDQMGKPWVDAKTWAVARVLDDHMDKDGSCSPSYGTIAEQARIGRTAAKDGVARLVGAGLLEVRQRRVAPNISESNVYRAAWGLTAPGGRPAPPPKVNGSATHPDEASQPQEMERCSMGGERVPKLNADGLCPKCATVMASGDTDAIQRLFALAASRD
jgi:hypothetical protein